MEQTNHSPSPPADTGQQAQADQPQAGPNPSAHQSAQPEPGALYQYQPNVGFVQVQGPAAQANAGHDHGPGAADNEARKGMHGQGTPEGVQPKFDQNKFGQMYGVVSDVMDGKADPSKLLGLFADTGGEFWKGALVGAAAVVLLTNDTVKGAVGGMIGSLFGEADPEGEQVTVKE